MRGGAARESSFSNIKHIGEHQHRNPWAGGPDWERQRKKWRGGYDLNRCEACPRYGVCEPLEKARCVKQWLIELRQIDVRFSTLPCPWDDDEPFDAEEFDRLCYG